MNIPPHTDAQLGVIEFVRHPRAKRITVHILPHGLRVSLPPRTPLVSALHFVDEIRDTLIIRQTSLRTQTELFGPPLTAEDVARLRREAKETLPPRLRELAEAHGLTFRSVRIQSSRSRWGSCSAAGGINLSLYLMLLPPHLADYVMLHELCHTREMNHGPLFWALMDSVTDGQAQALRRELRMHHIPPTMP